MQNQALDDMDLERERGITIKTPCNSIGLRTFRWKTLRFLI